MTHDRTPLWLSADLERDLRRWASDSGTPLSEFVEHALRDFMARNAAGTPVRDGVADGGECGPGNERRACCRRKVAVPAVVHTREQDGRTGRYRVAELRDISSSGIGLRFEGAEREHLRVGREFEVLFQFADRANPVRLACTACRKAVDGAGLVIGAMFREPFTDLDREVTA